jgi:phosphodiesterase/alkaline phosphatase D-like protein
MKSVIWPSRKSAYAVFLFVLSQLTGTNGSAALVKRGPYLQQGTPTSVVVRWRTDVGTSSAVGYGTSSADLTTVVSDSTSVTDHIVSITGLEPQTKYFYAIGTTSTWFTVDTNSFFITSPLVGTRGPTRIWALGDSGTASSEAAAARDAYTTFNGTRPTDVWLMLGDNAYGDGSDTDYQIAVYNFYPKYLQNTVLWPTIGNHDSHTLSAQPYLDMFTLPQNAEAGGVASGMERYYSFDYANIHFVCLDSATSLRTTNSPMANWLRADLEATTQEWIIAFFHHPPYTKGTHDSDSEADLTEMRQNMIPILESYGADLVLCGHSHNYERSFLLDGHYGNSSTLTASMKKDGGNGREDGDGAYEKPAGINSHEGTVYIVGGCSGHASNPSLHPAMYFASGSVGSLVIDVEGGRLDMVFLKSDATLGDHFTLLKAAPPTNAPAAPSDLAATVIAYNRINLAWKDNADNEQGFKLERSTNGTDFLQIATVAADKTNFADTTVLVETPYYYRLFAFNIVSNSDYVTVGPATTPVAPDLTPPAGVTNLLIVSINTNSATLSWTAPGDDENVGTATSYDLRFSTSNITTSNWSSATQVVGEPVPEPAGTPQSFTVNGLTAGRTYYFALKTSDKTNNVSRLSNIASGATPMPPRDTNSPAAITDLVAVSATYSNVTLSWTAPGDDGNDGTASSYDVRYSTSPITPSNWSSASQASGEPPPAPAGTPQLFTVQKLTAGRTYYFAIRTSDETNNVSPLSNIAIATVPRDTNAPAAVTNLLVVGITSSNATLAWTAPGDDGNMGTAKSYDLRYSTSPITPSNFSSASKASGFPVPALAGTKQSFTIPKLSASRTYYFAIKATDNAGNVSPLSNVTSATTAAPPPPDKTAPAAVTNLAVVSATSNSLIVSWTAPGDDDNDGTAKTYDLRYSISLITTSNWSSATQVSSEPAPLAAGSSQSFTATALIAGRTYYFALKTTDENSNVSPLSNIATGMTVLVSAGGTSIVFLIPSNSVWKYLDNGSDQGTNWIDPAFDDTAWASGPALLGYGSGKEATVVGYGGNSGAKYITTYFRRHFLVNTPTAFTNLSFGVQRDDGAIVYLNGIEVFRDNMPTGPVNYQTIAPISVSGTDKTSFHPSAPLPAAYLVAGDNIVEAEVHQHSGGSSSMDFNLELKAILAAPLVKITLGPGGEITLSWNSYPGKRYRLQYVTDFLSTNWATLGDDITATDFTVTVIETSTETRYYRVLLLN